MKFAIIEPIATPLAPKSSTNKIIKFKNTLIIPPIISARSGVLVSPIARKIEDSKL